MATEEMLSILDEDGKPTGDAISRTTAHEKGLLHAASHIYIYRINNNKIEILLQRRSFEKDSFPGKLDISSAGHVVHGMNYISTAQKELEEELGITVKPEELQKVFKQRFSDICQFRGKEFNNQEWNIVYVLQKNIETSELKLQKEEVAEVIWMDAEEIYTRIKNQDEEICIDEEAFKKVLDYIKKKEKIISKKTPFVR